MAEKRIESTNGKQVSGWTSTPTRITSIAIKRTAPSTFTTGRTVQKDSLRSQTSRIGKSRYA